MNGSKGEFSMESKSEFWMGSKGEFSMESKGEFWMGSKSECWKGIGLINSNPIYLDLTIYYQHFGSSTRVVWFLHCNMMAGTYAMSL